MSNTTFRNLLKKLAPEFGLVKESFDPTALPGFKPTEDPDAKAKQHAEIEKSVLGQIDKSEKLDEVDTVTFGLETDDNKIVKVYVNAEQAVDFEKELAQKLGEIDDIEEVLNELSKKFEIVDVEWPDEEGDGEDTSADDDEPTGGESMDPKVYKKDKKMDPEATVKKADLAMGMSEHLTYGERVALELTESMSSIEQRLSTPSQLLIYHAILALGVPEVALTKSPYRSAIVNAIKEQAIEINKDAQLKLALKGFVKLTTVGGPKKPAEDAEEEEGDEKKDEKRPAAKAPEKKPEAKKDEKKPEEKKEEPVEPVEKEEEKKPVVKEGLETGGDFWAAVTSILKHVTVNETTFDRLTNCPAWNRLVSRSQARVSSRFIGPVERRMNDLIKMLPVKEKPLSESITVVELENLLNSLFEFADPDPAKKYAAAVINAPQMKQFMMAAKSVLTQRFSGAARTRMTMLLNVLAEKSDKKPAPKEPTKVTEAIVPATKDEGPWAFESTDKGLSISHGKHLAMVLDEENAELLSKGIANKRALVLKDVDGAKFTFSPRGVIVKVKASGTNTMCEMSAKEVAELLEAVGEAANGKGKDKKDEEEE